MGTSRDVCALRHVKRDKEITVLDCSSVVIESEYYDTGVEKISKSGVR